MVLNSNILHGWWLRRSTAHCTCSSIRKSPGKQFAVIRDAIEFAGYAINRSAGTELRSIAATMGFDPEEAYNDAVEEDE